MALGWLKLRRSNQTAPQVKRDQKVDWQGRLNKPTYGTRDWAKTVAEMKRQPTISFARILAAAPILAADWTIDKDSGNDVDYIQKYIINPFKFHLTNCAVFGIIDWGWQPFEIEWKLEDGTFFPTWYKPLLQEFTDIIVHNNGKFHHLINQTSEDPMPIEITESDSLVMSSGVEGTNWYGTALMANVEDPYFGYKHNESAFRKYCDKIAGAGLKVAHPIGITDGKDNKDIAYDIIGDFSMMQGLAVPKAENEDEQWEVDLMESSTGVTPFIERSRYKDSEFFRGLHLSERSGLEGQYGTKAESETQKDFSIEAQFNRLVEMLEGLNRHVQYATTLHYENATARIIPAPMNVEKIAYLRSLYTNFLNDPTNNEIDRIDMLEFREIIGIPSKDEDENEENEEDGSKALLDDFPSFNLTQQE